MLTELGKKAKLASRQLARLTTEQKNTALHNLADALVADQNMIITANAQDIEAGKANGLSASLIDRLMLNEARLVHGGWFGRSKSA
jgi:glutamate-5-semialdehyde dehydrogenase